MTGDSMTQSSGSGSRPRPSGASQRDPAEVHREKRKLRQEYRSLIESTEEARSNLADHDPIQLSQMIQKGAALYERVKGPAEGVLDSKFLLNAAEIGNQLARNLKIDTGFEIDDYLTRCATLLGGAIRANGRRNATQNEEDELDDEEDEMQRWDWVGLGRRAAKRTKRVPTLDFMLGPLAVEHKKRNVGKRAPVEKVGPIVRPEQLKESDIKKNDNDTTKLVREINDRLIQLGGEQGMNFFEFVIDPTSFSSTVENIFYLSFLVRDARVSIEDQNGEPILTSVLQPEAKDYEAGLIKQQIVMEFDIETYKELIEVYNIKEAKIPSRKAPITTDTWTRQ